jgi:hypothetical protein
MLWKGSLNGNRESKRRNWIAMLLYALAIPAAYLHPAISLALILGCFPSVLRPGCSQTSSMMGETIFTMVGNDKV